MQRPERSNRSSSDRGSRGGRGGPPPGGGGRGGSRGGDKDKDARMEKMKINATVNLEKELARTGYCRDGFIEMDTEMQRGSFTIIGDCSERASQADREKFTQ